MTTNELVTLISEEVGAGWTRVRIREFINRVQNEILADDCELQRVKPDPFIATTDGTYSYVASSTLYVSTTGAQGALVGDIRAVRDVYSLNSGVSIFDFQSLDPSSSKPNQIEYTQSTDRIHARMSCIDSLGPNLTDCTIRWWEGNNPGTTTVDWRAIAYKWPTQLTAETIALSMPEDFQNTLLFWGVLRHLERREYGRGDYPFAAYEKELKRFKAKYGRMANMDNLGVCFPRPC